jgi:hypothetical protein
MKNVGLGPTLIIFPKYFSVFFYDSDHSGHFIFLAGTDEFDSYQGTGSSSIKKNCPFLLLKHKILNQGFFK